MALVGDEGERGEDSGLMCCGLVALMNTPEPENRMSFDVNGKLKIFQFIIKNIYLKC